jgi:hypothetical protein
MLLTSDCTALWTLLSSWPLTFSIFVYHVVSDLGIFPSLNVSLVWRLSGLLLFSYRTFSFCWSVFLVFFGLIRLSFLAFFLSVTRYHVRVSLSLSLSCVLFTCFL